VPRPVTEGRPLNAREAAFVAYRIGGKNGAEAARLAGYSARSAKHMANELQKRPWVRDAIEAGLAEVNARAAVAQSEMIEQAAQLAAKEALSAQYVIDVLRENIERAMEAVPVLDSKGLPTGVYKYDGAVVNGAAKLLGEHLGMWTQKLQLSGSVSTPPSRLSESERDRMLRAFLAERGN
jgi:phage terminase small subunit